MASTPTTRNRFNKQGSGDNTGTWGNVLNTQAMDLVDEAIDGWTSIAVSGNVTLTSTNYVSDQARKRILKLTGAPGATYIVTIPSVEKLYHVINATNAAQTIKAGGVGVSIPAATMTVVVCDGTDCFTPAQTVTAAIGAVMDFAGDTAPSGWLLCYGQTVSRTTYAALFGAIGTKYGSGDGSTTFTLPDCRGRVAAGADNMGGVAAGRLTGYVTGSAGGLETHTLTTAQLPAHGHGVTDPGHVHGITDPGHAHSYADSTAANTTSTGSVGVPAAQNSGDTTRSTSTNGTSITINSATTSITIQNAGSGAAHNNVQPTIAFNKIIYAGV